MKRRGWITLVALLPLCSAAWAQVSEAAAERVMRGSGLWDQVAQLGPQMRAGLEQAGRGQPMGSPEAEALRRLAGVAEDAFNPVAVRVMARRELARRLDAAQLPALSRWFDSALGQRITALEVASSNDADGGTARAAAGAQRLERASPRRRELVEALSQATRSAEMGARLVISMGLGLQIGVARATGQGDVPPADELRARLQPQVTQLQAQMEGVVQALSAETYAPLGDAELEAYVQLAQSAAGRHLSDVIITTIDLITLECSEEMARRGARV